MWREEEGGTGGKREAGWNRERNGWDREKRDGKREVGKGVCGGKQWNNGVERGRGKEMGRIEREWVG